MDADRLDRLARALSQTEPRRRVLGLLAALPLAAGLADEAVPAEPDAAAAPRGQRARRQDGAASGATAPSGRAGCQAKAAQVCAGRCGSLRYRCNGRRKTAACGSCGGGQVCERAGGTCEACDVCASGCAFASVQAAITAAASGETIFVCPGTYGRITIGKNVTLIGAGDGTDAGTNTILDGGDSGTVVSVGNGATVRLEALRLTNGLGGSGGGVRNEGTSLAIARCTLAGNEASSDGGGIANYGGLTVTDSTITDNTAGVGGGGILNNGGTATLTRCGLSLNRAQAGGGIFNWQNGSVSVDDTDVTQNTSTSPANYGGGIHNESGTATLLNGSTVTGNSTPNCVNVTGSGCGP